MYTLGIETSCDETSCAVLKDRKVLSNITLSSLREHKKYGGVVPEIATRAHLKNIDKVLIFALKRARVSLGKIDLIAVTCKPGLIGALLVGFNFAKALSIAIGKPFVGVNHLYAHLFSPFLNNNQKLEFPFLGVVVSGGHTEIYQVDDFDKIKILGQTLDDACGEVFDKVAKAYNLGYPGGPIIDGIFKNSYKKEFFFKCGKKGLNLSFSGLKTALIYKKKELERKGKLNLKTKIKLISSFQYTAIEAIVATILEAKDRLKINRILCGGGVVANQYLRRRLKEEVKKAKLNLYISPKEYSGDNAAMVAGLGFYLYNEKEINSPITLKVKANYVLNIYTTGIRIIGAFVLGGIIGAERERKGGHAGLRTHILVSMGAALIMLISIYIYEKYPKGAIDPGRIAVGVVTGIGFLGAGTIIRSPESERVSGLTTAASIWVSAAIGMAVGCGYGGAAFIVTVLAYLALSILKRIEK